MNFDLRMCQSQLEPSSQLETQFWIHQFIINLFIWNWWDAKTYFCRDWTLTLNISTWLVSMCVYCTCVCSSPVRHRWVWEEPTAVPWRWLCKHGGQLPVCVPRGTRDRTRWVGLSRWAMRVRQALLLWTTFSGFYSIFLRGERKTWRAKRRSVSGDIVTEQTVWMTR